MPKIEDGIEFALTGFLRQQGGRTEHLIGLFSKVEPDMFLSECSQQEPALVERAAGDACTDRDQRSISPTATAHAVYSRRMPCSAAH